MVKEKAELIATVMELAVNFGEKKVHFKVVGKFGVYTACNKDIRTTKGIRATENKNEVTCKRCKGILERHPEWL